MSELLRAADLLVSMSAVALEPAGDAPLVMPVGDPLLSQVVGIVWSLLRR